MEAKQLLKIEGIIENIIFHNEDNGYSVFSVNKQGEETVCVGTLFGIYEGEHILVSGDYVHHPSYGRQFSVQRYEKTAPTTVEEIERYLSSGMIKGIGPKLAKKIVALFGEDTFKVIEQSPAKLAQIRGITKEKALKMADTYYKQIALKNIMIYLQQYNISPNLAVKIYQTYQELAIDIIKSNPYKLADDIPGVGFKTADNLADAAGIDKLSMHRIKAGIKYMLNQWAANGHVYVPKPQLTESCAEMLEVSASLVETAYLDLQMESGIKQEHIGEEEMVYLSPYYYAENNSARRLAALHFECEPVESRYIQASIEKIETRTGIRFADKQTEAVRAACAHGVVVITGGPGTGKTTTINAVIEIFKSQGLEIILAAPTGRAAKRMTEATGYEAQTIHRLLQIGSGEQEFVKNEEDPLEADVFIIDEMSMVDILLLNSLLKAIPSGARLIMAGDADQLPSVGAGNVLKDIIQSKRIKVVVLDQVFRQAQESAIVMNAHRINHGEYPLLNERNKDFFFLKRDTTEGVVEALCDLITKRLPEYTGLSGIMDYQVLTPMRKSPIGVVHLNKALQQRLNPPGRMKAEKEFREYIFRVGDKVMQIKNNYAMSWRLCNEKGFQIDEGTGIYNGDGGIISKIDDESESVRVVFDDGKQVDYDYSQLEELEPAYAVTIHKSQGSEYPVVIVPVFSGPYMLMTRNLLYTAVTRARKLAVIVGSKEMLYKMVDNDREISRYSSLDERIGRMFDLYEL